MTNIPVEISLLSENSRPIFSTYSNTPTPCNQQVIKTPWLKNTRPAYLSINNNVYPLIYLISKNNKEVLTITGTIDDYYFVVIVTFGSDPARPSYIATITLTSREIA